MASEDFDFENFEPAGEADDTEDLRDVAAAVDALATADARLREAVTMARAHGRSWNRIAIALGVSRQAARQKYAELIH
jgi:DNA-directed RNA polymerase specialized sigma24 family protein